MAPVLTILSSPVPPSIPFATVVAVALVSESAAPPARPAIETFAVTETPTAWALDSTSCTLIVPALERTSRPAPPSIPIAVAVAVLRPSVSATPAATPPVMAPFKVADTSTPPASAFTFCSVIGPSFFSQSSPVPPSIPFAVAVAVERVSASAAPTATPALVTPSSADTVAAFAFAVTPSSVIGPRLRIQSLPAPPSMPIAVAFAVAPALLNAAPAATPALSDAVMATLTLVESASAVVRLSAIAPSLTSVSLPAPPSMPFAVDVAFPLVSASAAPAATPTLAPDKATVMPAACPEAPTSSALIVPLSLFTTVPLPAPPPSPVAGVGALPLASARPAAIVTPAPAPERPTEMVTAPASALTCCSVTLPALVRLSSPAPPSRPFAVALAVVPVLASAAATTAPFCENVALTLTPTALASALMSLATRVPRFESLSLPVPPAMPVAVVVAVASASTSAALTARPSFAPATASDTLTASASAFTPCSATLPWLMSSSVPLPPSSPVAVARALLSPLASAAPAPTPSLLRATESDTATAVASAPTFCAVIDPPLVRTSFPAPPSLPVPTATAGRPVAGVPG